MSIILPRIRFQKLCLVLLLIINLLSCRSENHEEYFKIIKPDECDTVDVRYSTHLKRIFDNHCIDCHYGGLIEGCNLNTYENVMIYINNSTPPTQLYDIVKNNTHKGIILNNCQHTIFSIWINNPIP